MRKNIAAFTAKGSDYPAFISINRTPDGAENILSLIEKVDPSDTAKLDEIDARVQCYRNKLEFVSGFYEITGSYKFYSKCADPTCGCKYPDLLLSNLRYTRSRDALKSIRPEGYRFCCREGVDRMVYAQLSYMDPMKEKIFYARLPSEELAELHAIIQAIQHERSQGG